MQVYKANTPMDVIRYLRDYHNSFHEGSGFGVPWARLPKA